MRVLETKGDFDTPFHTFDIATPTDSPDLNLRVREELVQLVILHWWTNTFTGTAASLKVAMHARDDKNIASVDFGKLPGWPDDQDMDALILTVSPLQITAVNAAPADQNVLFFSAPLSDKNLPFPFLQSSFKHTVVGYTAGLFKYWLELVG